MFCNSCGKAMKKVKKNYLYTESGLSNIILVNLTIVVCECGEEMPIIPHVESLHRVIAFEIIKSKAQLSGKEARFIRKQLALKASKLADILGVDKVTVSRWENENAAIGPANDRLIRSLYLTKIAEDLQQLVTINKLTAILSNISTSRARPRRKPPIINVPVNRLQSYNYGLGHC